MSRSMYAGKCHWVSKNTNGNTRTASFKVALFLFRPHPTHHIRTTTQQKCRHCNQSPKPVCQHGSMIWIRGNFDTGLCNNKKMPTHAVSRNIGEVVDVVAAARVNAAPYPRQARGDGDNRAHQATHHEHENALLPRRALRGVGSCRRPRLARFPPNRHTTTT